MSKANARFKHERANNTYSVLAAFCAELTITSIGLLTFIPGTAVAYFMMGFPSGSYLFIALVFWMVRHISTLNLCIACTALQLI